LGMLLVYLVSVIEKIVMGKMGYRT
jgi:hypothetical protein